MRLNWFLHHHCIMTLFCICLNICHYQWNSHAFVLLFSIFLFQLEDPFSTLCKAVLIVTNSLIFCLSWKVSLLHFLKDSFTRYGILGWQFGIFFFFLGLDYIIQLFPGLKSFSWEICWQTSGFCSMSWVAFILMLSKFSLHLWLWYFFFTKTNFFNNKFWHSSL